MASQYFIGREKELEMVEKHLLHRSSSRAHFQFALVWGPEGIGKSAFLNQFSGYLQEEGLPVVSFHIGGSTSHDSGFAFFRDLIGSARTNMGDMEPMIIALNAPERALNADRGETVSVERHWADTLLSVIENPENLASGINLIQDLRLIFIVDDYPEIPSSIKSSFTHFLNRISESILPTQVISLIISSESNLIEIPGTFNNWESLVNSAVQIRLEPLNAEETLRLLEAYDFDPNVAHQYFQETRGYPSLLHTLIQTRKSQSGNTQELIDRGHRILSQFNEVEKRWMKWAALLKVCNDETIAMMCSPGESQECMNWVRSRYPKLFGKHPNGYSLDRETRLAISLVVEQEQPKLFEECMVKLKQYTMICHTIPEKDHRAYLSLLAEFSHFTPELLRRVFANTADPMLAFLENKPVYFRHTGETWRLASNARASINAYNALLSLEDRSRIRAKIASAWAEKQADLRIQQQVAEKSLKEMEEKSASLGVSVDKIDKELNSLKKTIKGPPSRHAHQHTVTRSRQSRSGGVFTSLLIQTMGVVFLYVSILSSEQISFTYLALSVFCIAGGFILNQGSHSITVQEAAEVGFSQTNSGETEKLIDQLEFDKLALLGQKESTRIQIEKGKNQLNRIRNQLNQGYLPGSE